MLKEKEILNRIIHGDALEVLKQFPSEIVDCVVTSPPYYTQRFYPGTNKVFGGDPNCEHEWEYYTRWSNCWSVPGPGVYSVKGEYNKAWIREHQQAFCKKCKAWYGQLGLEPTPDLYIEHLVQIFNEVKRVLKSTGVFFLNIGDTYWSTKQFSNILKPKQLLMIPYRLAIRMQEEGWLLRNIIVWHKPDHMPHPVKDRLVSAYEPVFMFVKSPKYYFDLDAIREKHKWAEYDKRYLLGRQEYKTGKWKDLGMPNAAVGYHPLGKNPGDVWTIKTSESTLKHTAQFPEELVRRCLLAGCPKEVCEQCGKPKRRKSVKEKTEEGYMKYKFLGWIPSCNCNANFRPGTVLDPFVGSGTTALVARDLGLNFIGIELSKEYVDLANNRLKSTILHYIGGEYNG